MLTLLPMQIGKMIHPSIALIDSRLRLASDSQINPRTEATRRECDAIAQLPESVDRR